MTRHRPRPIVDAMARAAVGTRKIGAADIEMMAGIANTALAQYAAGADCAAHWLSLADLTNMSQTLADMRLGGGPQAQEVIEHAQRALFESRLRLLGGAQPWALEDAESDALHWLVRLYAVQLAACSQHEFERAYRRTRDRVEQAAAGNAAPGTVVVVGQLGGQSND